MCHFWSIIVTLLQNNIWPDPKRAQHDQVRNQLQCPYSSLPFSPVVIDQHLYAFVRVKANITLVINRINKPSSNFRFSMQVGQIIDVIVVLNVWAGWLVHFLLQQLSRIPRCSNDCSVSDSIHFEFNFWL